MFAFELSGETPRAFTQSGEEVGPRGARNTCRDIPGRVSGCTLLIPKLRICASFRYVIRPHNVSGICIGDTPVLETPLDSKHNRQCEGASDLVVVRLPKPTRGEQELGREGSPSYSG